MAELSAFILAYNEAENAPKLMASLKGVRDVVVLDNGSTDNSVELFRQLGALVVDGSQLHKYAAAAEDAALYKERFGIDPHFAAGDIFENAGERRNYAASLCKNDWVFNPDCDEHVIWDLQKVRKLLKNQPAVRYRFVHKHNADGTPLVEFIQNKLYNRTLCHYLGWIHEVIIENAGGPVRTQYCEDMVLHHRQREKEHRTWAIKSLEFQVIKDENPRNLYYLAREYATVEQWENALAVFRRYLTFEDWGQQRCEAHIFIADCHRALGRPEDAVRSYHDAMIADDTRREPFINIAQHYMEPDRQQWQKAVIYLQAALSIPFNHDAFSNDVRFYTWVPHDKLSVCYQRLGMQDLAYVHWLEAMKYLPDGLEGDRILMNGRFIAKKAVMEPTSTDEKR